MEEQRITPAPEVLRVFRDEEVGVMQGDTHAADDDVADFARGLGDFGTEVESKGTDLVDMHGPRFARLAGRLVIGEERVAHEEAVEEEARGIEGDLR